MIENLVRKGIAFSPAGEGYIRCNTGICGPSAFPSSGPSGRLPPGEGLFQIQLANFSAARTSMSSVT